MSFLHRHAKTLFRSVWPANPEASHPIMITPATQARALDGLLFICGLHRSGTTLLEDLLRARADVSCLRAKVNENEGQFLQDVYPQGFRHGGPGRFAFSPVMHPAAPSAQAAAAARARILQCWTPWIEGDAPFLIEKSPPNLTKIAWLRAVFPEAKFVILTRDPRVVAQATQKWSGTTYEELVFHWHCAHDAARRDMGPDCVHLRYEDLCADPDAAVTRVIEDLALPQRATPLHLSDRFANIRNTNAKYLADVAPWCLGAGAWDAFGYDLGPNAESV